MENNTDHSEQTNYSPLTVEDVDVDFLPIVYDIIRRYFAYYLRQTRFAQVHFVFSGALNVFITAWREIFTTTRRKYASPTSAVIEFLNYKRG